jgi:hypothetical protein
LTASVQLTAFLKSGGLTLDLAEKRKQRIRRITQFYMPSSLLLSMQLLEGP